MIKVTVSIYKPVSKWSGNAKDDHLYDLDLTDFDEARPDHDKIYVGTLKGTNQRIFVHFEDHDKI